MTAEEMTAEEMTAEKNLEIAVGHHQLFAELSNRECAVHHKRYKKFPPCVTKILRVADLCYK